MRLILFISLAFVSNSAISQHYDAGCIESIKEGTFYADIEGIDDYVVVRKKSKQVETCSFDGRKATMTLKIEWTGVTTYRLTPTKYKNFPKNYPVDYNPIDVTVIGCNSEYFTTHVQVGERTIEGRYYFSPE